MVLFLSSCGIFPQLSTTTSLTTNHPTTTAGQISTVTTRETEPNTTTSATTTWITTIPTTTAIPTTTQLGPVAMLNAGQDTVEIYQDWTDAGAVLVVGDIAYRMTTADTIDDTVLGLQHVTYSLTFEEVTYMITRYVMVVDQTAPMITLLPGIDTVAIGDTWVDGGVEITDNSGENLKATVTGTVDTAHVGVYTVTYTVEDSSGNRASAFRVVTVIDPENL